MAESTTTKKAAAKATTAHVPTRNAETAIGSLTHGEVVYLDASDDRVKNLVEAGYLMTQKDYLESTDQAVLNQMERDQGVSARESGSQPGE
jgi:hypothetical protein